MTNKFYVGQMVEIVGSTYYDWNGLRAIVKVVGSGPQSMDTVIDIQIIDFEQVPSLSEYPNGRIRLFAYKLKPVSTRIVNYGIADDA